MCSAAQSRPFKSLRYLVPDCSLVPANVSQSNGKGSSTAVSFADARTLDGRLRVEGITNAKQVNSEHVGDRGRASMLGHEQDSLVLILYSFFCGHVFEHRIMHQELFPQPFARSR